MNTSNLPLVSVIIPAYNHERYVEETVRSVLAQTYSSLELIVINDGSTDATWQKLQELKPLCEERFVRTYIASEQNAGCSETLNKLVLQVRGKYVFLIASDDVVKPQAIAREVEFLEQNPDYALVVGDNELIDAASKVVGWNAKGEIQPLETAEYKTFGAYLQHFRDDVDFTSDNFGRYGTLLRGNYLPNGCLLRADALKKLQFTKEAPLEDLFMHLQLAKQGKFKFLNEILF